MTKSLYVILRGPRWAVERDGEAEPISVHDRKQEAQDAAIELARREGLPLVIFDVGGRRVFEFPAGGPSP